MYFPTPSQNWRFDNRLNLLQPFLMNNCLFFLVIFKKICEIRRGNHVSENFCWKHLNHRKYEALKSTYFPVSNRNAFYMRISKKCFTYFLLAPVDSLSSVILMSNKMPIQLSYIFQSLDYYIKLWYSLTTKSHT